MPLPDWNRLPDEVRDALVDEAVDGGGPPADLAHAFYERLRDLFPGYDTDLIPPAQREAAALLLSAVDLPAPMADWARQIMEAAIVAPQHSMSSALINSRRAALERARELIDQLLLEAS